jgi:uncharacterized protein (DUF2249 family)
MGTGNVSVIVDENGNLSAVRADFNLKGSKSMMMKTIDELNAGERLNYVNGKDPKPALVVRKKSANISTSAGGEFVFAILSEKPDKYKTYSVFLRKHNGAWIAKDASGETLKSVDLTPNAPGLSWNGTFSSATFK